jgi:hypothetical protein
MSDGSPEKTARIRELNDQLRCKGIGGRIVITAGIHTLGPDGVCQVIAAVARFDDFTEDNDPWSEHDCAVLDVEGRRVIFKVDLYEDPEVKGADGQPVTTRVLTIMLAEEW